MGVQRVVADLTVTDLARSTAFYRALTGLDAVMDMGWVRILADAERPECQLLLVTKDLTAQVNPHLSIEVDDVDASYRSAVAAGLDILHPLTTEAWGIRRFFVRDPDGHVVNVVGHA